MSATLNTLADAKANRITLALCNHGAHEPVRCCLSSGEEHASGSFGGLWWFTGSCILWPSANTGFAALFCNLALFAGSESGPRSLRLLEVFPVFYPRRPPNPIVQVCFAKTPIQSRSWAP